MKCIPNCSVVFQQLSDRINFCLFVFLFFCILPFVYFTSHLAYVLMQDPFTEKNWPPSVYVRW